MSHVFTRTNFPPYEVAPVDRNDVIGSTFTAPKLPMGTRAELIITSERIHPDGSCPPVMVAMFHGARSTEPDADGYYSLELKIKIKEPASEQ